MATVEREEDVLSLVAPVNQPAPDTINLKDVVTHTTVELPNHERMLRHDENARGYPAICSPYHAVK